MVDGLGDSLRILDHSIGAFLIAFVVEYKLRDNLFDDDCTHVILLL
jgi:hypothetical protein